MDKPLVSMIVLEYNNFQYIFECLDSIIAQDYPNIELIINGDGGEKFDEIALINYLYENKSANIKKTQINNNEVNIGTVRCCNQCVKISSGKYYMLIAADDVLYDSSTLSTYVNFYESVPENSALAIGRVIMMDIELKKILEKSPSDKDEKLMYSLDSKGLFNVKVQRFFFPMIGMMPRSYYDMYNGYDEEYKLIEDVPFYTKALCRGTKIHYLGIPTYTHRDGGISHGNKRNTSKTYQIYVEDSIKVFEKEYLPNTDLLTPKAKRVLESRYTHLKNTYTFNKKSIIGKIVSIPFNLWILKHLILKIGATVSMRSTGIKLLLLSILCFVLYYWKEIVEHPIGTVIQIIIGCIGLAVLGLFALLFCIKLALLIIRWLLRKIQHDDE